MSAAPEFENQIRQAALRRIAAERGVSDTPQDEAPFQQRRKQIAFLLFLMLLSMSIGLELQHREITLAEMLHGLRVWLLAFADPGTPTPPTDWPRLFFGFLAVVRNLIPSLAAFALALWLGARFVHAVYGLSDPAEADHYLRSSLFGESLRQRRSDPLTQLAMEIAREQVLGGMIPRGPFVVVQNGEVVNRKAQDPVMRIGGPGTLIVYNDSAVLLERAGQLTRVVGPGSTPLLRFEKVRDIITLRPLTYTTPDKKQLYRVEAMTEEGIPVVWPVEVRYQINDEGWGHHTATEGRPYAFAEEAVLRASIDRWMRGAEGQDHLSWDDRVVVSDAEGILRDILARHPLDRLIQPLHDLIDLLANRFNEEELREIGDLLDVPEDELAVVPDPELAALSAEEKVAKPPLRLARSLVRYLDQQGRIPQLIEIAKRRRPEDAERWDSTVYPRQHIARELEQRLQERAAHHGAKLLSAELHNLELKDPVVQQWLDTWQARWRKLADEELAKAKEERAYQLHQARAAAQDMLWAIKDGLDRLEPEQRVLSDDVLAMRLIETLSNIASHPRTFPSIGDYSRVAAMWEVIDSLTSGVADEPAADKGEDAS